MGGLYVYNMKVYNIVRLTYQCYTKKGFSFEILFHSYICFPSSFFFFFFFNLSFISFSSLVNIFYLSRLFEIRLWLIRYDREFANNTLTNIKMLRFQSELTKNLINNKKIFFFLLTIVNHLPLIKLTLLTLIVLTSVI